MTTSARSHVNLVSRLGPGRIGARYRRLRWANDLDERLIQSLKQQGAAITVWGVGTKLVTAYDQRAIEAFDVNAVDYLLKPVDPTRLDTAVQRARRRIAAERQAGAADPPVTGLAPDQLEKLLQLVSERQSRRERLAIKVGDRLLLVQSEDIIHASLVDETITIVTAQYAGTSNYRTLDELQARLDPSVFWRVHRSHLVNINKIKEIVPWFSRNYILRMKDEKATEIPVSRTQTKRLREYLKI